MIDIHSHILPGVDDGADTLETSVGMLRAAAAAGTTDIVATPHANLQFKFDPEVNRQLALTLAGELKDEIRIHQRANVLEGEVEVAAQMDADLVFQLTGKGQG